jgi:hypothetical protein
MLRAMLARRVCMLEKALCMLSEHGSLNGLKLVILCVVDVVLLIYMHSTLTLQFTA